MRVRRDVVRVAGSDAGSFLQGQLSQDVENLGAGGSAWSLVLQPQGKVDALVRVTRLGGGEFVLDLDDGFGGALVSRLDRFKLRVKADIELLGGWTCTRDLSRPSSSESGDVSLERLVVPFRWGPVDAIDTLEPEPSDPLTSDEVAEYETWRIEAGVPAMGKELTEGTIPEEVGVVDVTVSFTKGCYTGQELVARIDSRGRNVPRRLRRLRGPMREGDELVAVTVDGERDGKAVGSVTSASGEVGLGYVSRQLEPPVTVAVAGRPDAGIGVPQSVGMIHVEALPPVTLA